MSLDAAAPAHYCWAVRARAFDERVAPFVADGLTSGERVVCSGVGPASTVIADLARTTCTRGVDLVGAHHRGQLVVLAECAADGAAPHHARRGPGDAVPRIADLVEDARRVGYNSVRLVRRVDARHASPRALDAQVHAEHLIDRLCLNLPLTCICLYDPDVVDDERLLDIACVHRHIDRGLAPFRLSTSPGADLALFGSVDTFSSVAFVEALDRIDVTPGRMLRFDLGAVEFIDHSALLALDEHGMRRGVVFELRRAPYAAERLVRLLELRHVRLPLPLSTPTSRAPWVEL